LRRYIRDAISRDRLVSCDMTAWFLKQNPNITMLHWTARASTGLLSAANAEWVHFLWNWIVLLALIALLRGGMRNAWSWLLLAWALAHTLEHSYMFIRHLQVLDELRRVGVTSITAQGLPGVLGRDGWLARSEVTQGTFLCRLPGVTTATRLDVHFWWNIGETLLLLAANIFLVGRMRPTDRMLYRAIETSEKD
jgi:hypothetical protein